MTQLYQFYIYMWYTLTKWQQTTFHNTKNTHTHTLMTSNATLHQKHHPELSWTATCEKCGSAAMPVPMAVPPKLEVQNLSMEKSYGRRNIRINWVWPLPSNSDLFLLFITFLGSGIPINLYLPLLLGRGHTQRTKTRTPATIIVIRRTTTRESECMMYVYACIYINIYIYTYYVKCITNVQIPLPSAQTLCCYPTPSMGHHWLCKSSTISSMKGLVSYWSQGNPRLRYWVISMKFQWGMVMWRAIRMHMGLFLKLP